jgi:AbrB family looped-hinge helix DNA binding protein
MLYANIERSDKVLKVGILRQVDSLGRIVIPKELRSLYQIETNDQIEIIGTDGGILLKVPGLEIKRIREEK